MRIGRLTAWLTVDRAEGEWRVGTCQAGVDSRGEAGGRMMPGRDEISERQSEHHCQREKGAGLVEEEGQSGPTFSIYTGQERVSMPEAATHQKLNG